MSALTRSAVIKNKKNFIQPCKPLIVKNRSLDEAERNPGTPWPRCHTDPGNSGRKFGGAGRNSGDMMPN